jgi:hypothetical protein
MESRPLDGLKELSSFNVCNNDGGDVYDNVEEQNDGRNYVHLPQLV